MLSLIAEAAQSLAAADDAAIVLLDRDTKSLKIQNLATSARWKRHLNRKTLTRDIIESGKIFSIADLEKLQDVNPQLIACGYRSLIGIPIPGHEGSLGVLYTYSRTPNHFEQWGRTTVLQTLADQAGLAIANAQAYEQVRKHAGFMESLVKAAEGLTRTTDESGQLSLAWDFIREQLHVKTFFIALYNRETDTLRFALAYDEDKKIDIPSRQLGEDRSTWGIAGHAVKSGQELNWRTTLEKEEQCRTLDIAPQQFGKSCKSCFCFPIRSGSEIIGALSLQDYREHAFTSPQLAACRALGSQLAVALENTRLLASIQHASRRADALNQVVLDLSKEQDRRSLMQAIIREARSLTEAEGGAIYLLDPAGQQFKMEAGVALPEELEGQLSSKQDGVKGFILETGKPQAVSDYYRWERRIRDLDDLHLTAVAGAPIQVGMHILGVIIVHSTEPDDRFRDDDLLLLQQLANHVGLAIQKATLLDRLKAIQELSTSIASTADSSSIFTSVCKEAVELFGADHSGMVLFEPELTRGIVKAEYPASLKTIGLTIPVTEVQAELGVVIHQKPLVLEHLEEARQELGPVYDILHGLGIRSILIVPIVYQNRVLGSFSLDATERPRAFTEQEVELCKVFASHVAVAIENARLFEETSRRERLLDALAQASLNIRAEQDTPTFLHQVVRSAVQLLDSDAGCILMRHPHLGEVEVAGVCELPEVMLGKRIPQTEGIINLIISSGKPQVIHEYATWSERCAIHTQTGLKSVIGVPLRIGGEIEAVLMVGTTTAERFFSKTDTEVLERFAQQAALTLHSSRLMTQEQRILSQLSFLRRISDSIQAARDLDQILHMVLTGITAGYGFGFNRAAIFLAEDAPDQLIGRMGIGRMAERDAQLDWEEHRRRGRENIDVYMRLLAEDALEPTPIGERIRGLVLPIAAGSSLETVLKQGDCLRLNDADMDILPPDVRAAFEPASPLIVAPLRAQEEVIGILIADNKFTRAPITDDLVEALLTFVNTAVIAIQNTKLFKSLQEEKSRLGALYAASNAVTLSPDPVQTLEASVERARIAAKAIGYKLRAGRICQIEQGQR